MSFYWVKTRWFIKKALPNFIWDIPGNGKKVYLTFDDGPTPDVTEWVLEVLKTHNIKATFFCIGNNIENHPDIFQKVIDEGHAIGNHTFNHLNGWNTGNIHYFDNINSAEKSIRSRFADFEKNKLFRPPYGKITASQSAEVRRQGYRIIMWDVLSADFDQGISPEKCLRNVITKACNGSVIIFHDSVKASVNLKYTLPKAIKYLKENGFSFEKIN